MKLYSIENHKNIYIEPAPNVQKYLTKKKDKKGKETNTLIIDMDTPTFEKANKSPLKIFNLWVRVTKVIEAKDKNGKPKRVQKQKKKLYKFDGTTIKAALKELTDAPAELLATFDEDANRAETEALAKVNQAKAAQIAFENKTLNSVWDEFYKYKTTGAGKKWRDSTANNYKSFYSLWIRDRDMGDKPVIELTKSDCKLLIDEIAEIRAIRTATTVIEILRPMVEWYFDENEIDKRNPVPSKKDYPFDNKRVIDIELPDIARIYKAMDVHEQKDLFKWLRTGRRRGEIAGLTVENIDLEGSSFLVTADTNKSGVDMEYELRDEMRDTITKESGNLFGLHKDTISKYYSQMIGDVEGTFKLNGKRVKISEHLNLHDLRHIINGVLKAAEVPEETRGKVLGHKRQSITDRYGKHYYGDIDKAFQLFLNIVYGVVPKDTKWGDL